MAFGRDGLESQMPGERCTWFLSSGEKDIHLEAGGVQLVLLVSKRVSLQQALLEEQGWSRALRLGFGLGRHR